MLRLDAIYQYRPSTNRQIAHCGLRIYDEAGGKVVVLTERGDNPGMSVTNAAEEIATSVAALYQLDIATTTWLEHYTPASYKMPGKQRETFDLLTFTWHNGAASNTQWQGLFPETVARLLPDDPEIAQFAERERAAWRPTPGEEEKKGAAA